MSGFSLPTQRCFRNCSFHFFGFWLFSAYAEVFLRDWFWKLKDRYFSLPTQRCFCIDTVSPSRGGLFSAYAEVFPNG